MIPKIIYALGLLTLNIFNKNSPIIATDAMLIDIRDKSDV